MPIAAVENARHDKYAFFSCDYDVGDASYPGYCDYRNGWQKASSVFLTAKRHFGEKSVYIDLANGSGQYGPSRNVRIYEDRDYIMSACVLVEFGTLIMYGDYRYLQTTTIPHQASDHQMDFGVQAATASTSSEWQYIELRIPA